MSSVFAALDGHEQVVFSSDPDCGLRCIVAIHSTALGPALGGIRFQPYPTEEAALRDVLALARAMTFKAACAGLDNGGGKAVIIGDPAIGKTDALLRSFGRVVQGLGGRYLAGCDVGTTPDDLAVVATETSHAHGRSRAVGGSGDSGELTAHGVHVAIRTCAERVWGTPEIAGRTVAVQGVGKVGARLALLAKRDGARVLLADRDARLAARVAADIDATVLTATDIHRAPADIFSPNALGGVVTAANVSEIRAAIVAGGANNQLAAPGLAALLAGAGVLYAPDFVVNSGGLIQHLDEREPGGYDPERARQKVTDAVGHALRAVFGIADRADIDMLAAAERLALRRLGPQPEPDHAA